MKKEINVKKFQTTLSKLEKEMKENIVEVMIQRGVKAISFVNNGDSSSFDVDKAYATIYLEDEDAVKSSEVIVVVVEENELYISTDYSEINLLMEADVYSPTAWENFLEENEIEDIHLSLCQVSDTLDPIHTLADLASSISEVLEGCMEGKPLGDGGTIIF